MGRAFLLFSVMCIKAIFLGGHMWVAGALGSRAPFLPCSQVWPSLGARRQNHLWTGKEEGVYGSPGLGAGPGPGSAPQGTLGWGDPTAPL